VFSTAIVVIVKPLYVIFAEVTCILNLNYDQWIAWGIFQPMLLAYWNKRGLVGIDGILLFPARGERRAGYYDPVLASMSVLWEGETGAGV